MAAGKRSQLGCSGSSARSQQAVAAWCCRKEWEEQIVAVAQAAVEGGGLGCTCAFQAGKAQSGTAGNAGIQCMAGSGKT